MQFLIDHQDTTSKARSGRILTQKGIIHTPIFMPVGTRGSVKSVPQDILENHINADIILGNSYHLYLRPGMEILAQSNGLHGFMGWHRPILTDSGGYQE